MSRYLQIYQVHIVDGFVDDCDELLHRCRQVNTLTYDIFTEIWKGMGFAYLYKNRATHVEVAEMSEEFIHIAKRYMLANTSNYEDSVMGLFVVYALLNLQPYPGFAPLRLTPDDVPAIARIESVARRERRFDVLRVLGSVLIEGPCHYTIVDRARGLETGFKKYFEGYTSMDTDGSRPKGVFYRQNTELDLIKEMINLDKRYSEAKKYIAGVSKSDACLNYTDPNLPQVLETSLRKVLNGVFAAEEQIQQLTEESSKEKLKDKSEEPEERYNVVQQIKKKAMKGTVNTMNHLRGVQERCDPKFGLKRKCQAQNKESGNIKSSSPKKPIKSGTPKKRKSSKTVSPKKKRLRIRYEEDSDSDDSGTLDLPSSDDDIDPITDEEENPQSPHMTESKKIDESTVSHNHDENRKKELEVSNTNLGSLPILISTGDNNEYIEIEVVDEDGSSYNSAKTKIDNNQINVSKSEIAAPDLVTGDNNEYIEIEVIDGDSSSNDLKKSNTDRNVKNVSQSEIAAPDLVKTQTVAVADLGNEEILKRINELPHLSIEKVLPKNIVTRSKANISLNSKNDDDLFKKPKAIKSRETKSKPMTIKRNQKKCKPKASKI